MKLWQNVVIHLVLFTLLFATYKLLFVEQEDNMTKQGDGGEYWSGWRTHPWNIRVREVILEKSCFLLDIVQPEFKSFGVVYFGLSFGRFQ